VEMSATHWAHVAWEDFTFVIIDVLCRLPEFFRCPNESETFNKMDRINIFHHGLLKEVDKDLLSRCVTRCVRVVSNADVADSYIKISACLTQIATSDNSNLDK